MSISLQYDWPTAIHVESTFDVTPGVAPLLFISFIARSHKELEALDRALRVVVANGLVVDE